MYKNKSAWALGLVFICASIASTAQADIAIIANVDSGANSITVAQAAKLWLGKKKKLSGAGKVKLLEQDKGNKLHKIFHKKVTKKNATQLKAYWAKIVFTGKAVPPKAVSDDSEAIEIVSENKNTLAYIDSKSVTSNVKVLMTIK